MNRNISGADTPVGQLFSGRPECRPRRLFFITLIFFSTLFLAGCPKIKLTELPKTVWFTDPLSAEEHADLGAIYEQEGNPERALQEYAKALKKDPKNVAALTGLGNLALGQGRPKLAIRYYERALKVAPENAVVLNNLAMAWLLAGDAKKALAYADQAVAKSQGQDPRIFETRAQARKKAGDETGAQADLEKARLLCLGDCPQDPNAAAGETCDPSMKKACAEILSVEKP
jgi:Tfp pilus assembly protein PilF